MNCLIIQIYNFCLKFQNYILNEPQKLLLHNTIVHHYDKQKSFHNENRQKVLRLIF